jgi:outer membrane protein OmpA-like peptidoglycan-associated protein
MHSSKNTIEPGGNLLLLVAALSCLLSSTGNAQDFSNLENPPKVVGPSLQTRGIKLAKPIDSPVTRSYIPERGVVIVEAADGSKNEEPYVVLPILFKRDSAALLDAQSQSNLEKLAELLKEPSLRDARFCIEGHTSTEGAYQHNMVLSVQRAHRIFVLLTEVFSVDKLNLREQGFGPDAPEVRPEITEQDRERNRRVLVVREQ